MNGGLPRYPGRSCIVDTGRSPCNWAGNWRWNPGGNLVNELAVAQNPFTFTFTFPTSDTSGPTFTDTPITNPETFDVGTLRTIDTWQIVKNLSWLKASHSVTDVVSHN